MRGSWMLQSDSLLYIMLISLTAVTLQCLKLRPKGETSASLLNRSCLWIGLLLDGQVSKTETLACGCLTQPTVLDGNQPTGCHR
ncbi:hypothetical protein GGR57DRAFT_460426 [Xylariaceae sp. FL1272]|nr:hypothetical protein GGR57DRAFT_460426 [Xylariaceae sp. FL1272]